MTRERSKIVLVLGLVALLLVTPEVAQARPVRRRHADRARRSRLRAHGARRGRDASPLDLARGRARARPARLVLDRPRARVRGTPRHRGAADRLRLTGVGRTVRAAPADRRCGRPSVLAQLPDRAGGPLRPARRLLDGLRAPRADHPLADLERAQLRLLLGPEAGRRRVRAPARDLPPERSGPPIAAKIMLAGVAAVERRCRGGGSCAGSTSSLG